MKETWPPPPASMGHEEKMRRWVCRMVCYLQLPGAPPRLSEGQMVPFVVVKACASSQHCSSLPSLRYVILRYINGVKGNYFQRRAGSCNFS